MYYSSVAVNYQQHIGNYILAYRVMFCGYNDIPWASPKVGWDKTLIESQYPFST